MPTQATSRTDTDRRSRRCGTHLRRAEDLTDQDVIRQSGRWTEVLDVYRNMEEWEATFGTEPPAARTTAESIAAYRKERQEAEYALDRTIDTYVLVRLLDLVNSNPGEIADMIVRMYRFELVETQDLPTWDQPAPS